MAATNPTEPSPTRGKRRMSESEDSDVDDPTNVSREGKRKHTAGPQPSEHEETNDSLQFEDPFEDEFDSSDDPDRLDVDTTGASASSTPAAASGDTEMDGTQPLWDPRDGLQPGDRLDYNPEAYKMMHAMQVEWPCLSFDFIADNLGFGRTKFPHTMYAVAGSQADEAKNNKLYVMKMSDLCATQGAGSDDEGDEDSEEVDSDPILEYRSLRHAGGVNRIRAMPQQTSVVATWADMGDVRIFDLSQYIAALDKPPTRRLGPSDPVFSFDGHATEGFALDWSIVTPGRLLTGDCNKFIYLWNAAESTWNVDKMPYNGHTDSVEDLQWSPNQADVFASCGVDRTVRIWDARNKAAPVFTVNAHEADVNVISWNKLVYHLLASGSDDGTFSVWDMRMFGQAGNNLTPAQHFKQHEGPITSIEWHPTEASALAVASEDNMITLWDMSLESDREAEARVASDVVSLMNDYPPQLLFIHMGQTDIKEIHWHPQIPGVMMSTALDGFNIFRTENF